MAGKPKHRMSQADRAKQFMPFSALKGLEEALTVQEEQAIRRYQSAVHIRGCDTHHGNQIP